MNGEVLLCDADDVIENLVECWINTLNRRFGFNVRKEQIIDWDMTRFFPELTEKQIYAPIFEKSFWSKLSAIPDCFEVIRECNEKYDLHIATATNYQTCDTKIERILALYPFLNWKQFIIASNKQLLRGKYLIDDGIHNLINCDGSIRILMSASHNEYFNAEENMIYRVHDWKEIYDIIKYYADISIDLDRKLGRMQYGS